MLIKDYHALIKPKRNGSQVKVSEKSVLRICTDFLEAKHILYIRINPIRLFNDKQGNMRASPIRESQKGAPDIIAFPHHANQIHIAIECKSNTGKQSREQKAWQARWECPGHIYLIVRSLDDLTKYL